MTTVVRADSLDAGMSRYLVGYITTHPWITVGAVREERHRAAAWPR